MHVPYTSIPGFSESTVEGHQSSLAFGYIREGEAKVAVVACLGRFHTYEGHSAAACVFPTRVMKLLGVEALVVVDAWLLRPADGDRLLLCSDGLFGELSEARIAEVLIDAPDPESAARQLAEEADEAGGRDNVTTVVVDVVDSGSEPAALEGRYRRISTPAVDLSDIDDDRDRTDTVLAVVVPSEPDAADAGGSGTGDAAASDP